MDDVMQTLPADLRGLRACLLCSLIKSFDQFETDGCENCDDLLGLRSNRHAVEECTSSVFDGLIGLTDPDDSWVAKWQRINGRVPGMYAISVSGQLPASVIRGLKQRGHTYRSRDRSTQI